jgi:hypothetical protein
MESGLGNQLWMLKGGQSGVWTRIATESVLLCAPMKVDCVHRTGIGDFGPNEQLET